MPTPIVSHLISWCRRLSLPLCGAVLMLAGVITIQALELTPSPANAATHTHQAIEGVMTPSPSELKQLLPSLAKKPLLLEFSSSYCGYCRRLAPTLARVAKKYPKVQLLVIDSANDMAFASTKERSRALLEAFQPQATPTLVAINQQGVVVKATVGAPNEAGLHALFKSL